tara:strand:+ start:1627 stop:1833 length:207 start_codon:yes stop_codon:yes gene_type:complete
MDMPIMFSVAKQMSDFQDISTAPKDGTIVFIMDGFGHIDLAKWDLGEWNAEFGVCDEPEMWARFHIDA